MPAEAGVDEIAPWRSPTADRNGTNDSQPKHYEKMMKPNLLMMLALLFSINSLANATDGYKCKDIEYARLKDATKQELSALICNVEQNAAANHQLFQAQLEASSKFREIGSLSLAQDAIDKANTLGDLQVACLENAGQMRAMMKKRFKTENTKCKTIESK